LYSFCSQGGSGCSDGTDPSGGLYLNASGNLFGTTVSGGNSFNGGTVFQLSWNGSNWMEMVLYAFCQSAQCQDGKAPPGPVVQSVAGLLYGITSEGGFTCNNANMQGKTCGTIYELNLDGNKLFSLYAFCFTRDCADGATPTSLLIDQSGNLYGTTRYGGGLDTDPQGKGGGILFRYSGAGGLSVMHNFCAQPDCSDGAYPTSLITGGSDEFFGSTLAGGAFGGGEVFHLRR
jgi:uncharacterized repeat protein (TIGR03803 family)